MAEWRRDPVLIRDFAAEFDSFQTRLQALEAQFSALYESVADSQVVSALQTVLTNWSVERDRLATMLGAGAEALRHVATQYENDEQDLAHEAKV